MPRRKVRPSEDGDLIQSLWYDVPDSNGSKDYPTEKSEELLDRIIRLTTNPGDLVLDCFIGSGTACAVAQRLGRRWIACDINKGAIQTTSRRLQTIIHDQLKELGKPRQLNTHPAADAPRDRHRRNWPSLSTASTIMISPFSITRPSIWPASISDRSSTHADGFLTACWTGSSPNHPPWPPALPAGPRRSEEGAGSAP